MKNKILPVLLVVTVLLTVNQASAYYSPSTGRWLSRDSLGEPGFELLRAASAVPRIGQVASTASLPPGRLLTRDPVASKQEPNRYAFVANAPTVLIDRDGLSWWRNLLCPCKCKSVQVTGKPVTPPGVGWYPDGETGRYGNLMTVTWTVSGNPKSCAYGQNEKGYSDATFATDPSKTKNSNYSDHTDLSGILPITYGDNTATYQDYMGIAFRAPDDDGDWKYWLDLKIDFTCTSSDGTKMTGQHLIFFDQGNLHF